jgi:hypothetical protein
VVRQKSTIERLRQSKPDLFENVSKQIEDLKQTSNETPLQNQNFTGSADDEDSGDGKQEQSPEPSPPKAKQSKFSAPPKVGGANRLQDFLKQ